MSQISRRDFLKQVVFVSGLLLLPEFWAGFSKAEQEVFLSWGQTDISFANLQIAYEVLS